MTAATEDTPSPRQDVGGSTGAFSGQANSGTAAGSFSETGHKAATDVNTEESLSLIQSVVAAEMQKAMQLIFANMKRTYDLHQSQDLVGSQQQQVQLSQFHQLSLQAIQNALETANMVGKQAVKHADNAASTQISILGKTGVQQDAMVAQLVEELRSVTVDLKTQAAAKA